MKYIFNIAAIHKRNKDDFIFCNNNINKVKQSVKKIKIKLN